MVTYIDMNNTHSLEIIFWFALFVVLFIEYNEEKHFLVCLCSLSEMQCKCPVDILGVDNESKKRTAKIFQARGVSYSTETQYSCGFIRLCSLENAHEKYHINIDSDTIYPPQYMELMADAPECPDIIAVCSLWSYIPDKHHLRHGLIIYEAACDFNFLLQSFKHSAIHTDTIRDKEGYRALQLKQFSKIPFISNQKAHSMAEYGKIGNNINLLNNFNICIIKGLKGMGRILKI